MGALSIKSTAEDTVGVIGRLGEKPTAIGRITKVIDEITERTNLLALNAAILAAQATDEQARGSRQVTEAIHRMTETVQHIAAAAATQARGSEQVQRAAEQTRALTGQAEGMGRLVGSLASLQAAHGAPAEGGARRPDGRPGAV